MRRNARTLICKFICLLLIPAASCFAQFGGGVQGSVQDKSGAVIIGATVTLTNTDTSVVLTAKSDDHGFFRFASLPANHYLAVAEMTGFAQQEVSFVLETNQLRDVPFSLAVSSSSSTVTVTAEAPLLDTSDSRSVFTINNAGLEDLPLASLNPETVVGLTPGVTGVGAGNTPNYIFNVPDLNANGRGVVGNLYVLDGVPINGDIQGGSVTFTPSADALSSVDVQLDTYSVEYGQASSIQTILTSRAGTDRFHGSARELFTYQGLYAKPEFDHPAPGQPAYAPFHTNNMSFAVGGPIVPNHKFFFFFSTEPYRSLASTGNSVQTYEDPAFVSFAQTAAPSSPELQLLTKYAPTGATTTGVAATAQQLFGASNPGLNTGCATPSTDNIPCATVVLDHGNFNSSSFNNGFGYSVRVDKYFPHDRVYGLIYENSTTSDNPTIRPQFTSTNITGNGSWQLNETHDFGANTLNEAHFGWVKASAENDKTGLFTVPVVSVAPLSVGWGTGFATAGFYQHQYQWGDMVTRIQGSHSFRGGFQYWHGNDVANFASAFGVPSFNFTNLISLINNNPYSEVATTYNPVTGAQDPDNYGYSMRTFGVFAEDTWKATKRLTLNYGIRYDDFGNAHPNPGTLMANFHLGQGSTYAQQIANGVMTQQTQVYASDMNWIFSPRGGFTWDPTGKGLWLVKGGVGIYRDLYTVGDQDDAVKNNPPAAVVPTFFNNGSTAAPIFGYGTSNSYPFGYTFPAFGGTPLNAQGGLTGSQISVGGVDPHLGSPRTLNWSATLERSLTPKLVTYVSYLGSHSSNLLINGVGNQNAPAGIDVNVFQGDLVQHPDCNGAGTECTGIQTRLNHSFGSIQYAQNRLDPARQNYYALVFAISGRLARRGFITGSYTRSSSNDDWLNYPAEYPTNQFYGPSYEDTPNRLSLGIGYELPGMNHGNGLVKRVTSGWTVSDITILQSGYPFTVITTAPYNATAVNGVPNGYEPNSGDFNADGDNMDYPDVSSYKTSHARKNYINGLFPLNCANGLLDGCGPFTYPQFGTEGTEKMNQFRNPGFAETDFALKKNTQITEGVSLELRGDFFNIFNRVNLNGVDNNAADLTTFGTSTSSNVPRNMQLGARLFF